MTTLGYPEERPRGLLSIVGTGTTKWSYLITPYLVRHVNHMKYLEKNMSIEARTVNTNLFDIMVSRLLFKAKNYIFVLYLM